jgi:hypothetical protein
MITMQYAGSGVRQAATHLGHKSSHYFSINISDVDPDDPLVDVGALKVGFSDWPIDWTISLLNFYVKRTREGCIVKLVFRNGAYSRNTIEALALDLLDELQNIANAQNEYL